MDGPFRPRWPIVAITTMLAPAILAVLIVALLRPIAVGVVIALLGLIAFAVITVRKVRRRSLLVTDEGLDVQRDGYALHAPWAAVTGVRRRRLQGVLPVDELLLADSTLIGRNSRGVGAQIPPRLSTHASARRIQVSIYDKNWRDGRIGSELRSRGLL